MTEEGRPSPRRGDLTRADRAERAAEIIDGLDSVERGLDPAPARRGQFIADGVAVGAIAVAVLLMGMPVERPLVLVMLLLSAAVATRVIRRIGSQPLRDERERLLERMDD